MQPEDEHTSNIHSGHNLNFMKISRERPCHELKEKILLNEKKETNYLGLSIHYGYTDINIFFYYTEAEKICSRPLNPKP
jgi:hypothetical protein